MQNDKKNPNTSSRRILSVDETTTVITAELELDAKASESLPQSVESVAFESSKQSSSSVEEQTRGSLSEERAFGSDGRPLLDPKGTYFASDSHETDDRVKRLLTVLQREQNSSVQKSSLLLDDLKELGMFGELSEDSRHFVMPFKDVHRLVMTMKMAELILNDRVQDYRKAKIARIAARIDADNCPNMSALLLELDKAKHALQQNNPFDRLKRLMHKHTISKD
jgi:hypothetical protein